jgi:hypothetical protein
VADIIPINNKLDLANEKKADLIRKRKISAVQKVLQCTHCAFKCEKCGTQIERETEAQIEPKRDLRVPYNFCDACKLEYIDYIERLKGEGDPDSYWHNEAWIDAWKMWIDYQSSVDRYLKSKEFKQLLQEFKQSGPEK